MKQLHEVLKAIGKETHAIDDKVPNIVDSESARFIEPLAVAIHGVEDRCRVEAAAVRARHLITGRMSLEQWKEAFDNIAKGGYPLNASTPYILCFLWTICRYGNGAVITACSIRR